MAEKSDKRVASRQFNFRVDAATERKIADLQAAIQAAGPGLPVSISDVLRLGVDALAEKYLKRGRPAKGDK